MTIHMTEAGKKEDVSGWKNSSIAGRFRALVRRAEKAAKSAAETGNQELAKDLEEILYELKLAVCRGDLERAEYMEDDLRDCLDEGER